jgi:hypothetical protein
MISGGDGGANTNASGKPFEQCVLMNHDQNKGYLIGDKKFRFFKQGAFTRHMADLKNAYWKHDKQPDGAYVSEDRNTVFIIECKHQIVSGTADEKLRCGPCLLEEYKQLYPSVKNIHMMFIVNDWWFRKRKYEIPIKFNEKHGIPVFLAKHGDKMWKFHINKKINKWTLYPALYTVDEKRINDWMTQQLLQSL